MTGDVEIRLHGRGGQGTVTMAALLVDAAWRAGWHVLGFPSFGTERTGAPVAAFVRLSHERIRDRSEVRQPSLAVVQDATLIGAVDVTAGLTDGGLVIVNAHATPAALGKVSAVAVPVTELAIANLGVPITNTAMLGVIAAATSYVGIDDVCAAIADRMGPAKGDANVRTARAAYEATQGARAA